jgi:RNA polymerase sigma-70 factor (ECF subfamily)
MNGDIDSFQELFSQFQNQLLSYLYRLLTDRNDADDLVHDTFIKAFDKIATFKQKSSLKTWVFKIATHLAYDHLKKFKRWQADAQDKAKQLARNNNEIKRAFQKVSLTSTYEIKEHIDFCFTCISKTLPIENQVALILKDVYDFSIKEICLIIENTEGIVKHLLNDARKTMTDIFENRCALINKNGVCHQCSELNGLFNPKQNQQQELMKLELVKGSKKFNREELFELRTRLVRAIDPLGSKGTDLQDVIMKCTRKAIGEI